MWSVDVSPPKDQERLPTVVPKSEMFEKKRNQVITWTGGGGKRHTSAGRDDRGRFTTGTQLEVSIARHRCRSVCSAAFTAAERGSQLLPLAVTTTVVVVVVVAFSPFVCLRLDFIWCPFLFKKRRC